MLHTATGKTDGTEFSAFESYTPGGKIGCIYHDGNMTAGWDFSDPTQAASRTIAYNGDNMPKTIVHAHSGTTSLKYDGDGTRVKKGFRRQYDLLYWKAF